MPAFCVSYCFQLLWAVSCSSNSLISLWWLITLYLLKRRAKKQGGGNFLCVLCLGQGVTSTGAGKICPKCLCSQQMVLHWWPRARDVSGTDSSSFQYYPFSSPLWDATWDAKFIEGKGSRGRWKSPLCSVEAACLHMCIGAVQSEFPLVVFRYVFVNL